MKFEKGHDLGKESMMESGSTCHSGQNAACTRLNNYIVLSFFVGVKFVVFGHGKITLSTRSVRKVFDLFLCEHLMDYNLARLHEPTLNLSART